MGQTTPNIGIYIPAAGEDGYDQSFAAGMVNIDQHDHSGGPNKGLPIATEGLGDFSVTFNKLNANVVDPTTGVGVSGALPNQIILLHPLDNIFKLNPSTGFVTIDGDLAHARVFQNSSTVTWTNADGGGGNPSASVDISGLTPVNVANGGTGDTSFSAYDIICGGTTSTGPLQQVSGEGTTGQFLGSNGPSVLPSWQAIPAQTLLQATVTLSAFNFRGLNSTPFQIIAPQGSGVVIIPVSSIVKFNFSTTAFTGASNVVLKYYSSGTGSFPTQIYYPNSCFLGNSSGYFQPTTQNVSSTRVAFSSIENIGLYVGVDGANFSGGGASTITFTVFYTLASI